MSEAGESHLTGEAAPEPPAATPPAEPFALAEPEPAFTETKVGKSRTTPCPRSAERMRMAAALLEDGRQAQGFWRFRPGVENEIRPVSDDYDHTLAFRDDLDHYFDYRIDYYPFFNEFNGLPISQTSDLQKWHYFVDINDETTEQKFQPDQDIRSFISGFRLTIERNRWRIIWLKRRIQAFNVIGSFLPAAFVAGLPLLGQAGAPVKEVIPIVWGVVVVAYALALFGATSFLLWFQGVREGQLSTVIGNNGKTLASALQRRANNLGRNFVGYLAKIDAEETTKTMSNSAWTDRSAWWMRLCLWNPKRIEYIEKFLQSEMQRIRIFMLRTSWQGYGLAYGILLAVALAAAAFVALETWVEWAMKGPTLWALGSLGLYLVGVVFGVWFTNRSLITSITLGDISVPLGAEPMGEEARFSDLDFDNKLAEQIRKDKEKIRQAFLRGGGFGDGSGRG